MHTAIQFYSIPFLSSFSHRTQKRREKNPQSKEIHKLTESVDDDEKYTQKMRRTFKCP
jgi:hypothetical protein